MANKQTVADETIIAALLHNSTLRAAAAAAGIFERALHDRMSAGSFQELYKAAKAAIVRESVINLNSKMQAAINTVAEIMEDNNINPAVRLQAAQTIINNANKFSQRLQMTESLVLQQVETNRASF